MRILRKTAYSCALLLLCLIEVKAYPLPTVTLGHEQGLHHIKSKQSGNIILPFGQDDRFQGLLAFEGKQYRLGGRVIQEHSGDQERFSVWGVCAYETPTQLVSNKRVHRRRFSATCQ